MRSTNWGKLWTKLKPHGEQVRYLWKKTQLITPVGEISTYCPAQFFDVLTNKKACSVTNM